MDNCVHIHMIVNVGIVGCGVIGTRFGKTFRKHDKYRIKAVCDIKKNKVKSFSKEFGGESFTNYRNMIDKSDIDLVYIGVPPALHKQVSDYALDQNKHIICEKPLGLNYKECKQMVSKAEKSDRITAVNLPFRYTPGILQLKNMINQGKMGEIRRVELRFRFPQWPRKWQDVEWLTERKQGGPLREVGTHFFFAIHELLTKVKEINTIVRYYKGDKHEKEAIGYLKLENNTLCSLDLLCGTEEPEENRITIYGNKFTLSLVRWYKLIKNYKLEDEEVFNETRPYTTKELADQFYKAVNGKEANLVSYKEAADVQQVLDKIYASNGKSLSLHY